MIEDFSDDFGILDGSQDPYPALASRANADVNVEDPLKELRPAAAKVF